MINYALILLVSSVMSTVTPTDSTVHIRRRGLDRALFVKSPRDWESSGSRRNAIYTWKAKDIQVVNSRRGKIKNINNGKQSQSILQRIGYIR
jgi:hypothetical protein